MSATPLLYAASITLALLIPSLGCDVETEELPDGVTVSEDSAPTFRSSTDERVSDALAYCDGPQTANPPTSCVTSACCECPECDDFRCDLDDKAELGGICGICKSAVKTSVDDTAKVMDDLGWNCSEATGALWASCNAALDLETDGLALIICTAACGAFKGACNAAGADPKEIIKHDDAIAKTACKPACWFHDDY